MKGVVGNRHPIDMNLVAIFSQIELVCALRPFSHDLS